MFYPYYFCVRVTETWHKPQIHLIYIYTLDINWKGETVEVEKRLIKPLILAMARWHFCVPQLSYLLYRENSAYRTV